MTMTNTTKLNNGVFLWLFSLLFALFTHSSFAADTKDWLSSKETNMAVIDHQLWQTLLDKYLISNDPSGVNLFHYKKVSSKDKVTLEKYLTSLQTKDPRAYNKGVQKAYWINLYNALTVQLILDNYPVKSITKLGKKFFSFGPWDDDAAVVSGSALSLNDIEHKILRPIFKDPRIHYAVNCASYSCPNLSDKAYTVANTDRLLTNGAHDYINHHRAVKINGNELLLSSIYDWYLVDFGDSSVSLLKHLKNYAKDELKKKLITFDVNMGDINYHYDWQLNDVK
ncbi:MAG: hypothetical protein ACI9T9_000043 [Oleiphilaceae bacterium]|jgi:hypothetical protein